MRRGDGEWGQGSLEYVAVVAVVALVLAIGSPAIAPGVANAVGRVFRHALCLVSGGDCRATEPRPCVVRADEREQTITLHAAFLRIGDHAGVLREDLSDGTVRVTEIDDLNAAGTIGVGAHGRVAVGGMDIGAGAGVAAEAGGWLGHTRTFTVGDRRAADELIDRLRRRSHGTLVLSLPLRVAGSVVRRIFGGGHKHRPEPDEVSFEGGLGGSAEGHILGERGDLSGALDAAVGGVWDRRSGRHTFYVAVGGEVETALRGAFAAVGLQGDGDVRVSVMLDRAGQPLELGVVLSGAAGGQARVDVTREADGERDLVAGTSSPETAAPDPDVLALDRAGRVELEAALDLTLPDNAATVRRFLIELRRFSPTSPALLEATTDLARRVTQQARIDVRAYATTSSANGVVGDIALGAKAGAGIELTHSSARLLAAYTRPAGGAWEQRFDCVEA